MSPALNHPLDVLLQVLVRSGETPGDTVPGPRLQRADQLLSSCERDPIDGAANTVRAEREAERELGKTRGHCDRLMATLEEMQQELAKLLGVKPVLCRLEGMHEEPEEREPRAIVALGGQLREVSLHESIDCERLRELEPWSYVLVHPEELVLVGIYDDPALLERSRGEVVEFQGYLDEARGWVRVSRAGHQESVARLAP